MELDVYKTDGKPSGEKLTLSDKVFGIEPSDHAIYQDVKRYMTNQRQGNASSKNRALVRGGGKKPWRQKGRGTARVGTIRSPLWVGGGRVFGPVPHEFSMKMPKKMKKLAKKSALTYKARQNEITIIEDFKLTEPKTREVFKILKNNNIDSSKVLLVTGEYDRVLTQAGRNIPNLTIRMAEELNTYDILNCQVMLLQRGTLEKIEEVC
ncbi:MAG: 50S ribosomal protein L4 [candidate division KSB1 bacterium]|jgi:large subunit ribosomal protein L4|nr:50S ribosomal protein L4 [candidate division KSB1 bacterium]